MRDENTYDPGVMPELAELCRIHDVGLELIEHSDDLDDLLHRVLTEYERRLVDMRHDTLDGEPSDVDEARKLRALVMFASQAAALKQKAAAATELRRRADELERLNEQLNAGVQREQELREQQLEERCRLERIALVMKALGVLSHKINNPLTTLLGRAQMLQMHGDDPYVKKAAGAIEEASVRIADYIRELAEVVHEGREESLAKLLDTERPEV
jgi:signal transduction histidine kinase